MLSRSSPAAALECRWMRTSGLVQAAALPTTTDSSRRAPNATQRARGTCQLLHRVRATILLPSTTRVIGSFFTPSSASVLSVPSQSSQSLDLYPSAPNNTLELECDDDVCDKSEWDMISVALATYKLYWFESQQKDADSSSKRRRRKPRAFARI